MTCGGGVAIKYREKIIEEDYGGTCEGEPSMEETCNSEACPGNNKRAICPNNTLFK